MRITGDTLEPSLGSNITVPNGMGINVSSTEVLEIGSTGIISQQPYWNIVEQQASGTNAHNGAEFTQGDWRTRFLNTTIGSNTITGSSLSSNQFTLPSGVYRIFVSCPANYCGIHKIRLRNITDSSDTLIGTSEFTTPNDSSITSTCSQIRGIFTITSIKTFEIQHRCSVTRATSGFGYPSSFSIPEIYSIVELWKLGN